MTLAFTPQGRSLQKGDARQAEISHFYGVGTAQSICGKSEGINYTAITGDTVMTGFASLSTMEPAHGFQGEKVLLIGSINENNDS